MTVEITSKGVFDQNSTAISITLKQTGDESAYDVEVELFESEKFDVAGSLSTDILESNGILQGDFTMHTTENMLPGKYLFVVRLIYHDANNHPFSIVATRQLSYINDESSDVHVSFSDIEITQEVSEKAILKIWNLEDKSYEVKLRLFLPRELESSFVEKNITIGPREEKEIKVNIESFGTVVAGNSYEIYASLEYEDNGFHYLSLAKGKVNIVEEKENSYIFLIAIVAFIVLILVFIYYSLKRRK